MSQNIKIEPAHCVNPGVTVTENGVIVSAVFRGKEPCGLILYNRADKSEITVQFTDEHRFGSLYSVQITPIDPDEWCYRLFSGSTFFVDPCCRSIAQIESEGRTIIAGGFFHRPDNKFPVYHSPRGRRGGETVIYSLHVRGFTMLDKSVSAQPGTFTAAAEKAGYLKSLGINAVELMPVYELQPVTRAQDGPRTMEDALALYPVGPCLIQRFPGL